MRKLILFSLFILVTVAYAEDPGGWNKAKWGMTEDELRKVFEGQLTKLPETIQNKNGTHCNYTMNDVKIGDFKFKATFCMNNDTKGLAQVQLDPVESVDSNLFLFESLTQMLIKKYGDIAYKRYDQKFIDLREHKWYFPTTVIELIYLKSLVIIMYKHNKGEENL
jgi:hypothetical protein